MKEECLRIGTGKAALAYQAAISAQYTIIMLVLGGDVNRLVFTATRVGVIGNVVSNA